ncbi:MAG: methyltransferase domain-containing protein [Caldimonas sp.]
MDHDDPAPPTPQAALDAGAEVVACLRGHSTLAGDHLLVVSIEAIDRQVLAQAAASCDVYRLKTNFDAEMAVSLDPWLPFDDAAFHAVVLYRVTRHKVDIDLLLGEAGRVLRPGGHVFFLEHQTDFGFAPLPESGPAHLLHGWLRHAGFAHVDLAERAGPCVVAVAHA